MLDNRKKYYFVKLTITPVSILFMITTITISYNTVPSSNLSNRRISLFKTLYISNTHLLTQKPNVSYSLSSAVELRRLPSLFFRYLLQLFSYLPIFFRNVATATRLFSKSMNLHSCCGKPIHIIIQKFVGRQIGIL